MEQSTKITQKDKIIEYLEKHGSITPLEAEKELGIMRLASRIYDLQASGYIVNKRTVRGLNRIGKPTFYAQYYINGRFE